MEGGIQRNGSLVGYGCCLNDEGTISDGLRMMDAWLPLHNML